jgi:L-iditol 2-dehydrogenase
MLAAWLVQPGVIELRQVPIPAPGEGEVLVRVESALTCGTDIKTWQRGHARLPGAGPFGHEFAGRIAAAGAGVGTFREGDAVACVPTAPCNACALCAAGRHNLCTAAVGRMLLGAYAEYVLVPAHITAQHLFPRPASLSPAAAAALEPLACVVHGAARLGWRVLDPTTDHESRIVIVGDGAIALLFARLGVLSGRRVLVVGRHQQRLAVAAGFGAATALAPTEEDARDAVDTFGGARTVVECVGTPESWRLASDLADGGGTVLLFGGCAPGSVASFDATHLHYQEVDHIGAFHYTPAAVRDALQLLATGAVDPTALVTHTMPLSQLQQALDTVVRRQAIKVEVRP